MMLSVRREEGIGIEAVSVGMKEVLHIITDDAERCLGTRSEQGEEEREKE